MGFRLRDRDLVEPGAVFYLTLFKRTKHGSIENTQELRFRRLPAWTRQQVARVHEDAARLLAKMKARPLAEMIDYGTGPAPDELEVMVFGPGYGEAITVHLGANQWMLVPTPALTRIQSQPASLIYLDRIGASPESVISVIASHWHDDHVRGFSEIVAKCTAAELSISATFNNNESLAFLSAYSGKHTPGLAKGAQELFQSVQSRDTVHLVHQRSNIIGEQIGGRRDCRSRHCHR